MSVLAETSWNMNAADFSPKLPPYREFYELLLKVSSFYENSSVSYRPSDRLGNPGGLLDFRCKNSAGQGGTYKRNLPLVVVPDLHARLYFLKNILFFKLPVNFVCDECGNALSVVQALEKNLIRLVCVGDGLHSEARGKERWLKAWDEFGKGRWSGKAMKEEMAEGLALMKLVMECKCHFPEAFHFLKGNHENIESLEYGGDFPFHKFVQESFMTRRFIVDYYGDDILYLYSGFEKDLPLIALFDNCIVSHAEPVRAFSYEELVDCRVLPEVVQGLIWTANGTAECGNTEKMLSDFTKNEDSVYFAGHRPIFGKYNLLNEARFIQIHNPEEQNVVLVYPDRKFNPETDIVCVENVEK